MAGLILDASALIAMLRSEPGGDLVAAVLADARMSVVNYAEVVSHYARAGGDKDAIAAMLRPFVSGELHWIAGMHGVFQGYYFFHYIGSDRDMREAYRGHPHFEACAEFCEKYDQAAFDPAYDSAPLSFFEPMVRRVFARPINSIYAKAAAEAAA